MRWVLILVSMCRWAGLGYGLQPLQQPYDGTYHFVSSSFPEVDSRGFYEHLFDDIGDYYPTWRRNNYKEYPNGNAVDNDDSPPHVAVIRAKRDIKDIALKDNEVIKKINGSDSSKNKLSTKQEDGALEDHSIGKRSPTRHVRGMEMGSSGFHEDMFNSAFGDFITMRRRRMVRTALKNEKVGDLINKLSHSSEDNAKDNQNINKLSQEIFSSLKHQDNLNQIDEENNEDLPLLLHGLNNLLRHGSRMGYFSDHPLGKYKRRPEMDSAGFHGDTFGGSFGDFDTMKKKSKNTRFGNMDYNMYSDPYSINWLFKRRPEMDSAGLHGDTFGGSFGDFDTMKKRRPEMDSSGFHGDTFGGTFGEFDTMKKRRPEMDSAGFHGDTFGGSFGDFDTMKKRRPEMDSSGFHGDTFGGSFGEFDTMKKRRPEMDSSGFHGDTFGGSFGEFDTMRKRRPEMDSAGFHGDTFGGSFGQFDTMKKRRPEMDSAGFHGDTFGGSFGDFDIMKKRLPSISSIGHSEMTKRSTKLVPVRSRTDASTVGNKACNCDLVNKPNDKGAVNKHRFEEKCQQSCAKII